jgi:hypothetical protein
VVPQEKAVPTTVIGCFGKLRQRPNVGEFTKIGDLKAITHDPTLIKTDRCGQSRNTLRGCKPTPL